MSQRIQHGTRYAYVHHGCRCKACAKANAQYSRLMRQRRSTPIPDTVIHGSRSTYINYRCRCAACRAAALRYNYERLGPLVLPGQTLIRGMIR